MSGLFKGIGKVFKRVAKVVKKIALPAILIGGVMLATGGMGLPALGGLGAGLGGLGAAGTAAAGTTAATGGLGAGLSAAGGAGFWGSIGNIFKGVASSPLAGELIKGAAAGYGEYQTSKMEEQQEIDAENRLKASYEGTGAAMAGAPTRGLGAALNGSAPPSPVPNRNTRPGAQMRQQAPGTPLFQYDPQQRRVVSRA